MNNLYQKYHGMPGIGIIGKTGDQGKDGGSIYFGFVKDFFDGVPIRHDARVKLAKRKPEYYRKNTSAEGDNEYTELMGLLWSKVVDSSNFNDTAMTQQYLINYLNNTSIYYSGITYDETTESLFNDNGRLNELLSYKFDIDNMPWMMAQMLSSIDDASILNDTQQFQEINIQNIKFKNGNGTIQYIDSYDYIEDPATGEFIPGTNISFDKIHVTYEPNDAAEEIGHIESYMTNFNDTSIYTMLDDYGLPVEEPINDLRNAYVREVIDGPTQGINTNTNDRYANIFMSITNSSMESSTFSNYKYIPTSYQARSYYVKNAIQLQDSILVDNEFVIQDGNHSLTYYGIDSSLLYVNRNDGSLNTQENILREISNSVLLKTENDLDKAFDKYLDRVTCTLASNPLAKDSSSDVFNIRWIADEDNIITIPSYLSSKYKVGDIIYFYTDQQDYITSNMITNMIVITPELVGCGIDTFLSASKKTNPFEIKYLDSINDRVRCSNKIITLTQPYDLQSNTEKDIKRFSYNSINNIIGSYSDSAIILADAFNKSKSNYLDIKGLIDGSINSLQIKANSYQAQMDAPKLKLDTMLVPNNSYIHNVETFRGVYDKGIIFDENKFLRPIVGEDIYEYLTADHAYLGTKLLASNYINTKLVNVSDYIYGYELYNSFGQLIQSQVSSSDELQMYATNLYPDSDLFETNIETYSVASSITVSHNNNGNVLDWDKLTFEYTRFTLIGKYVYFIYDSKVTSAGPFDKANTIKLLLSAQDLQYYTFASEYIDGKYYYDEKGSIIKSLKTVYQDDVIVSEDKQAIIKNVDPYISFFYMNVFAANKNAGVKYYSKMSKITYMMSLKERYISDYQCEVVGDSVDLLENTQSGNIEFRTSGITPEKNTNGRLIIKPYNEKATISQVYVNHVPVLPESSTYKNSWMNINMASTENGIYDFVFNTSSNVPNVYNLNNEDVQIEAISTINEYMVSLGDVVVDDMIKEDEAPLFQLLKLGKRMPATNDRYVLVSVEYTLDDSSTIQVENYNILQPGFKDKRDIPNVSINIHTDMERISKYNTLENGVLCNQFVTYMDINIDNFKSSWGQYIDNNTSIYMDLEIANINSDLDWSSKYTIQNATTTRNTIKIIPDENATYTSNYGPAFTTNPINNYVALNAEFVNSSDNSIINVQDVGNLSIQHQIKLQSTRNVAFQKDYQPIVLTTENGYNKQYILCDSSVMNAASLPAYIYKGINDVITISMNNITPQMLHDSSTYRIKLEYEMGNPLISSLYFRFAVKKVVIHYDTMLPDETGTLQSVKKTFTCQIPEVKNTGTYGYIYSYTSNNVEQYRYISNTLDVMINPLTYSVCPSDIDDKLTNMQGTVMKTGAPQKISKKLSFYSPKVYDIKTLMTKDPDTIRTHLTYDWSAFKLKTSYLQDNIKNINIDYVDYNNVKYDDIHKFILNNSDPVLSAPAQSSDVVAGEKYLNIVYHSNIMNPKLRDGEYTFFYNEEELERDRYNQINNNCPVFVKDTASLSVRDTKLVDSMDVWNFEYLNGVKKNLNKTFVGNINKYGNGYQYLDDSIDVSQYDEKKYLSLDQTKKLNDVYIYNSSAYQPISHNPANDFEPESDGYFRSMLYDIDWTYPYYVDNRVIPYQIVSDFDYLIKYLIRWNNENPDQQYYLEQQYIDKNNKLVNKYGESGAGENMIPYTLLFDLTPRIAYNTDNDSINVLMLRRPTIGSDNDTKKDFEKSYILNKRCFDIGDGEIQKLKIPYNTIS